MLGGNGGIANTCMRLMRIKRFCLWSKVDNNSLETVSFAHYDARVLEWLELMRTTHTSDELLTLEFLIPMSLLIRCNICLSNTGILKPITK